MPNVFCIRADYGTNTHYFLEGGYAGIGWIDNDDLSEVNNRDELYDIYTKSHPDDTSNFVIGQQVGQIARFLFDIVPNDYIITPAATPDILYYGVVQDSPYYYVSKPDECPYRHRIRVKWNKEPLRRTELPVSFQNALRCPRTVFYVDHTASFFGIVGQSEPSAPVSTPAPVEQDIHKAILHRVHSLEPKEFELLLADLLGAMGFEQTEHTGNPHDNGIDVKGMLTVANLVTVNLVVQAKRYHPDKKVPNNEVKNFRSSVGAKTYGAFITTADFRKNAHEIATDAAFPFIALINGRQLVELLIQYWNAISMEFQEKLGLRLSLIPVQEQSHNRRQIHRS